MDLDILYKSFQVMGLGMAGIFTVLLLIFVMIKVLLKVFPPKED
jgi:Na+-transporting methylmalonyl-CoA/oxaloacetate decarboxylase gamma subunit